MVVTEKSGLKTECGQFHNTLPASVRRSWHNNDKPQSG